MKKICQITDLDKQAVIPPLGAKWANFDPRNWGCTITVNPSMDEFKDVFKSSIWIVDVETDEQGKLFGLGISRDDKTLFWIDVPYLLNSKLGDWLYKRMSQVGFVGHHVHSDIDVLVNSGFNVTHEQVYWDTLLGSATEDPNKDNHALKDIAEKELGLSWPHYEEMVERVLTTFNKKGKEVQKKIKTDLHEVYKQHPQEVINYNAADLVGPYRLMNKQVIALAGNRLRLFKEMELPTAILVNEMKQKGLKVDRDGLQKKEIEYVQKEQACRDKIISETKDKDFNPNSPKQVLDFLRSRGHGINSTGEEILRPLVEDVWIKNLLEYRGVTKLLGTYIKPLLEHSAKDGRIHTNFNQIARMANGKERPIITGRFSSSNPINLQNQPPEVREYFIPEDGHVFVCLDYSQIDLRSLAHLSMEPVYAETFKRGEKVHQAVADLWKVEYKLGKIISLALAYNGGPGRLMAEAAGWGVKLDYWQCKRYADEFITKLATLTAWKKGEYEKAKRLGGVFTLFGRWIPLPYPVQEEIQKNAYCIKHWENCVIAFQGQGGTADIVKGGMLRLRRKGLIPNAQVHDELLLEVREDEAKDIAVMAKYELEHVTSLRVPLVAEVGIGRNWSLAKPK